MANFIRQNETAHPNARKPVNEIRTGDIVYLDDHPCQMSDPPMISHLESMSSDGSMGEVEENLVVVRGVSVIDGKEYDQLYNAGEEIDFFFDDYDEREWLVVCLPPKKIRRWKE